MTAKLKTKPDKSMARNSMLSFTHWKTRWPVLKEKGEAMSSGMKRRKMPNGSLGYFYAEIWFDGKRYRKSLRTTVKEEAQKRYVEYYLAVERGDSKQGETKFEDLKYEPTEYIRKWMYNKYLLPAFKGQALAEIDLETWLQDFANKWKPTTVRAAKMVLRELGFDPPKVKYNCPGKRFDDTQILEEQDVLDVIDSLPKRYRAFCLVAAYSMLRRGDVLNLRKRNVDFKNGWIKIKMSKTGRTVSIPISRKLREAFALIKVVPMKPNDRWFPKIDKEYLSKLVSQAFTKAGFEWATFHHFRHFGACFLIRNGLPIEKVQRLLGHTSIAMTQIYARINQDDLKVAAEIIDTHATHKGGH